MNLMILARLHILHPNLIEEDLLLASQHLDLVSDDQIEIRSDLLDESVWLQILEYLLVSFNKLINVRFTQLHHELFPELEVERDDFEYKRLILVSHDAHNILFAVNDLAGLAEKSKVLEIMVSREAG